MAALLTVDLQSKRYSGAAEELLARTKWRMAAGELIAITGPSGCGKTTLLNIIAGLDNDYRGRVEIDSATPAYGAISFVFQEPRLLPWRTVRENILLVLRRYPRRQEIAAEMIHLVGLAGWENAYPSQLSVGMARRVALARALAPAPRLLLLDEPFVSLDKPTAAGLRLLLLKLLTQTQAAAVFVTHQLSEALQLADRLLILEKRSPALRADIHLDPPRLERQQPRDAAACRELEATLTQQYAELLDQTATSVKTDNNSK
ncbi:MAG: ABC transporter ATP-binding protein [Gammaproteobacteria bacterium]